MLSYPKYSFFIRAFTCSAALLALSSCDVQNKLNDMQDKTGQMATTTQKMATTTEKMATVTSQMNNTTQGMAKTTDSMAQTTAGMADVNQHMYLEMRQSSAATARKEALDGLKAATSIAAKAKQGVHYNEAFEYEFWKPELETEADLAKMKEEGAREFMAAIQDFTGKQNNFSASSKDPNMMNLYAIAATLHYSNRHQYVAKDAKPTTMLSMIEEALKADADVQAGKISADSLPGYQQMILRQKPTAIYLLQIRHVFLAALPLEALADIQNKNWIQKGEMLIWSWEAKIKDMDISAIRYQTDVLGYARATREFLQSIGLVAQMDPMVWNIYENIQFPALSSLPAAQTEKDLPQSLQNLEDEVHLLVKQK